MEECQALRQHPKVLTLGPGYQLMQPLSIPSHELQNYLREPSRGGSDETYG
jgi:hypothetical protein